MAKKRMSRRSFLRMASGVAAGAVATACQPKTIVVKEEVPVTEIVTEIVKETVIVEGTPKVVEKEVTKVVETVIEKVVTATPPPPEPVTIQVQSGWCMGESCDIWTPAVEMFHEKNPMINVEMIRVHVTAEDAMTAMAGGTAPDVYHRYTGGFEELMARGVMYPLDDLVDAATDFDPDIYLETQWDSAQWAGVTYGIPVLEGGAMPAFSWHKPLLEEIGADAENGPSSWPEALEWARALNKYDDAGNLTQAGYDPQDSYGVTVACWPLSFDATYISEDKRTFAFDQESWRIGLETLAQFWIDAGVEKMEAFAQEWRYWTGPEGGFTNAKRAMLTNGNWQPGAFVKHEDVTGVDPASIGYGWHPCLTEGKKHVNFGESHLLFMPKVVSSPQESFEFMAYMTSVEANLLEFDIRGICMWSKPILEVIDLDSIPGLRWFFDAPMEADKLWGPKEVSTPVQAQVENLWDRAFEETIYGTKTAEDALLDINTELQQSLDEYWEAQG